MDTKANLLKKLIRKEVASVIQEAMTRKQKFVLYTNPNNSTNAAYVAWGPEVRDVLKDARQYPGSYKILYQGSGTSEDAAKIANSMFRGYRFNNI